MPTSADVIIALKIAVTLVTILLLASLLALARGRKQLHGKINILFFVLTMTAVVALEVAMRIVNPALFTDFDEETRRLMNIHLCFAIPATILLPILLYSGLKHRRGHVLLGGVLCVLWIGIVVTGIFLLPPRPF